MMIEINRRVLTKGALAVALAGGAPSAAAARAEPAAQAAAFAATPLDAVHPELRPFVSGIEDYGRKAPPLSKAALPGMRAGPNPFQKTPRPDVPFEARQIPVGPGHPDVTIYIVNAKPGAARPAILHTHGGGYVMGSAKDAVPALQETAKALDCVIVSVDYRLAPETTYAGSIEDNYAGLRWLHGHAGELGADPGRIAVMGESAGGGHAALLAITARDRGEVPLAFQLLVYPMLDDRTGTTREVPPHIGTLLWSRASNRLGWESFLGTEPGRKKAPKGAVPARVEDLRGLPPAFIGVGSIDLFVEEDIDYARRLTASGVMTELIVTPGAFHGFDGIAADTAVAKSFNAAKLVALRRGLGLPLAE